MPAKVISRGRCALCGRSVALRIPKGGDGTGLFPVRHKAPAGGWCAGWMHEGYETREKLTESLKNAR